MAFEQSLNEDGLTSCTGSLGSKSSASSCGRATPTPKRKKTSSASPRPAEKLLSETQNAIEAIKSRQTIAESNEFEVFGRMLAQEMMKVNNEGLVRNLNRQLLNLCIDAQENDALLNEN